MFPYNILLEQQNVLKEQVKRLSERLEEDNSEVIKNELTEAKELLNLVEYNLLQFKRQNTNK